MSHNKLDLYKSMLNMADFWCFLFVTVEINHKNITMEMTENG